MEHTAPARSGKEMHQKRHEAFQGGYRASLLIILALGLVGPVDHQGPTLDVVSREESPVAAVLGVVTVVAHHKILIGGNRHGPVPLAYIERSHLVELRGRCRRRQ